MSLVTLHRLRHRDIPGRKPDWLTEVVDVPLLLAFAALLAVLVWIARQS